MFNWVDDATITCTKPAVGSVAAVTLTGQDNCWYDYAAEIGSWKPKTSMTADFKVFRTVGKDPKVDVAESSIWCWDELKENVVQGSAECWPYEITG